LKCAASELARYLGRSCRRVACWVLSTVSGHQWPLPWRRGQYVRS